MKNHSNEVVLRFDNADELFHGGELEKASAEYLELVKYDALKAFCYYRLAQIANMTHDPQAAFDFYYKALSAKPDIFGSILAESHPSHNYIFTGKKDELAQETCPLCGAHGVPYWCYPLPEASNYSANVNPIRMWLYCGDCHHLFAGYFPEKVFMFNNGKRTPNTRMFSVYSQILSKISEYTEGITLLEIGVGAGECALAAREMGFEVFGIDVIERHVRDLRDSYGLDVETHDFIEFETDRTWDIIMMGDVLEHVSDPVLAVKKAYSLLNDNGALWVSTPNFESAFSVAIGHDDAMRRQTYHINYFSRESFFMLLQQNGLIPVDYQISEHYNGSMEVISVKKAK